MDIWREGQKIQSLSLEQRIAAGVEFNFDHINLGVEPEVYREPEVSP